MIWSDAGIDDEEANQHLIKPMRAEWQLKS